MNEKLNRIQYFRGLISWPWDADALYVAASDLPDNVWALEIGCLCGMSTACLASGIDRPNSNAKVACLDIWCNPVDHNEFLANMESIDLLRRCVPYRQDAVETMKTLTKWGFGLVVIDAGHSYEDTKAQFEATLPLVLPHCRYMFHDKTIDGVARAAKEIFDGGKLINRDEKSSYICGERP